MNHDYAKYCCSLVAVLSTLVDFNRVVNSSEPKSDWLTWRSTYTHDPVHGMRVDQYAIPSEPVAPARQDFQRSGFRHYRSTLQAGQSADNLHVVEQWGRPVEPYEQWRFPFRPYGVPYDAWGPPTPYGIINGGWGYGAGLPYGPTPSYGPAPPTTGPVPMPPYPGGPSLPPGSSSGFPLIPPYQPAPWFDGNYPMAPPLRSPFR